MMVTRWSHEQQIYVCGVNRASDLLMSTSTAGDVDAVISIADPYGGKRPPRDGFYRVPHRLILTFDDCLADGHGNKAPTVEDVRQIIAFGRSVGDLVRPGKRMLIHCFAGISRSTAAALIILADRLGPGHEEQAAASLIDCCEEKQPYPNETMLFHADALLGRGGKLKETTGVLGRFYRLGALLAAEAGRPDPET